MLFICLAGSQRIKNEILYIYILKKYCGKLTYLFFYTKNLLRNGIPLLGTSKNRESFYVIKCEML